MKRLFPNILGNEGVKNRIGTAILSGRAPHAFLIDGPLGSGKYTLALGIAAALNCERRGDAVSALPCGKCQSCEKIFSGGHVDVKTLCRQLDKATIGVGEIKEFREDMFLSATEAEKKVYIIREAEKLTPEAQNALLIVLEEPPKNVVILLLASGTDSILTTVKSRAQYVATSRFTPEEIAEYITSASPAARQLRYSDKEAFDAAVMGADGCIGRALLLINPVESGEVSAKRRRTLDFIRAASPRGGYALLSEVLDSFPTKRAELREQFEVIIKALRDMIAAKRAEGAPTVFFASATEAREAAEDYKIGRLLAIYDLIIGAHADCVKNANVTALITSLCAAIRLLQV